MSQRRMSVKTFVVACAVGSLSWHVFAKRPSFPFFFPIFGTSMPHCPTMANNLDTRIDFVLHSDGQEQADFPR